MEDVTKDFEASCNSNIDIVQDDDNENNITDNDFLRNCWQAPLHTVYFCHDMSVNSSLTTQSLTASTLTSSNSRHKPFSKHDNYWEQQANRMEEWEAAAKEWEKE
eukprot:6357793-Ditylum_brightwellii.AAC.1